MSIEKDLGRTATALESIAESLNQLVKTVQQTVNPVISISKPTLKEAEVPKATTQPPTTVVNTTPPPVEEVNTTPPPVVNMTVPELNAALVAECTRLGDRKKIDDVMAAEPFRVKVINDLDPSHYGALIEAIKRVK